MGEQDDGSIIEFESRDVNFIENEFLKLGEISQDRAFHEIQDLSASGSLHSSGREEENENIVTFSQSDANVRDLESSGMINANSSGSMNFQSGWTIPNYDEYQRYVYQDSEPRRSIRKRN